MKIMKIPISAKIILIATALPLFAGCMSKQPVSVAPQVATADNVYVGQPTQPPPPNQKDIIPPPPGPAPQWWFLPGHWEWRGQWVWVPGHWRPRPHSGDVWIAGKWVEQNNQTNTVYVWQKGHWRSGAPADEESSEE